VYRPPSIARSLAFSICKGAGNGIAVNALVEMQGMSMHLFRAQLTACLCIRELANCSSPFIWRVTRKALDFCHSSLILARQREGERFSDEP
jgi:hypothetical protein